MSENLTGKKKEKTKLETNEIDKSVEVIVEAMREKKANDIVCMDLAALSKSVCDRLIITSADSTNQVRAIADSVEEKMGEILNIDVWKRQGDDNSIWIILDYGNLVVHVFQTEYRQYYKLEELWADAEVHNYE